MRKNRYEFEGVYASIEERDKVLKYRKMFWDYGCSEKFLEELIRKYPEDEKYIRKGYDLARWG